ncbi:tRNA 2'-phosphotransferase [Saccharomycopsis crataegensis]|uniref:2'-phosphotransferase n=1 Tax=Saccharomycopsis crataegensis TaxID=43959 RepID=A0AAV5QQ77_9ASCO|nr:tRNA 2'-phosphotransferase [Saccharomycopsis crataegensis]
MNTVRKVKTRAPRSRDEIISKQLAWLLRHGAQKEGLSIDSQGYVPVPEVLAHNKLKSNKTTFEDLQRIVGNDKKQRYTLKSDDDSDPKKSRICANQGHSLQQIEVELTKLDDSFTDAIIHGTSISAWKLINESGALSRMTRNHIHFAVDVPANNNSKVISGMRNSSNVFIYIDKEKAEKQGIEFYRSINQAILSSGNSEGKIPVECFAKVVDRQGNYLR